MDAAELGKPPAETRVRIRSGERGPFTCGGRAYTNDELLAAAERWGVLESIVPSLTSALVCRAYAEENAYGVDDDLVQQLSEEYRRARNLDSAAATQYWLEQREVSLDDFADYLERSIWASRFAGRLADNKGDFAPARSRVQDVLWSEFVFGGAYDACAAALARRVALARAENAAAPAAQIDREAWREELNGLEMMHDRACARLLSRENLQPNLERRRLDLMQIKVHRLRLDREHAAKEAYLCLIDEGESFESLAEAIRAPYDVARWFLSDLPPSIQSKLLSAAPGQVLPPFEHEREYWIVRIDEKIEPSLDDDAVRQRLEGVVVSGYFDPLVEQHIEWH